MHWPFFFSIQNKNNPSLHEQRFVRFTWDSSSESSGIYVRVKRTSESSVICVRVKRNLRQSQAESVRQSQAESTSESSRIYVRVKRNRHQSQAGFTLEFVQSAGIVLVVLDTGMPGMWCGHAREYSDLAQNFDSGWDQKEGTGMPGMWCASIQWFGIELW